MSNSNVSDPFARKQRNSVANRCHPLHIFPAAFPLESKGKVKVMSQTQSGLIDALVEIGKERQRILTNLRAAYVAHDLDGVLHFVSEIVGVEEKLEEEPREKSH
jgi:hypothetical protein